MNKWGGIENGEIPLYTNSVYDPKYPNSLLQYFDDQTDYTGANYLTIFVPKAVLDIEPEVVITYDREAFVISFAHYGFFFFWILFLVVRFMKKIDYRIDGIDPWLASRVTTGEEETVLGKC